MTERASRALVRLLEIMADLRSPGGCPWDAEQTPESLKPYIIEEAYEVLEAIDTGDPRQIRDELGDLLLQVVFQSRLFEERGEFDMADVATAIAEKLVRRHPHVFAGEKRGDQQSLNAQWDRIKAEEKREKGGSPSVLGGVPQHLPALLRARKLADKASRVGFDWPEIDGVFAKVHEELAELEEAMRHCAREAMADELGDLLFAIVNIGRFLEIDAEDALRRTIDRFVRRFGHIERELAMRGRSPQEASLEEMNELWEAAKKQERSLR